MRFHIGFSKRIKLSTLLKIGAVLLGALGIYFGSTSMVFASESESAFTPSQVQYYSPQYADPLTASVSASGDNYWWLATINNYGGNSTNVNFIYNANNVCNISSGTSTKVKFRYTVQYNGSAVPSNISGIYASGGGSINFSIEQASANDYWATAYIDLSRSFRLIFAQSNQTTETINMVGVSKNFIVDCAYSIQNSTEDIINNNNQNTQDIINNNNSNTQAIIDSNKVCSFYDKNAIVKSGYLISNGSINSANNWGVTDYINFKKDSSTLKILESYTSVDSAHFCQYDVNKTLISCSQLSTFTDNFNFNSNVNFIRVSILGNINKPQFNICTNGSQATTDSINDLHDSLTDSDTSSAGSSGGTYFGNVDMGVPNGLTSIVTAPIRLLQSLANGGSCNGLSFDINLTGTPKTVTIPSGCILWNNVPSAVVSIYYVVVYGLLGYRVLVDMVHFIDSLRDPDKKNEYTLDL